ncbi:MAG: hypothetical protein M1823_003949 [Watsoniomyces obsoletus]|nr:MAG: hypothetical protein M1823_003949 [Watsoniomyces obsoletus]
MKFLPLREFDDVTRALNFDTPDCHVIGGCDLYTTKAAGSDKKLYKNIEHSLETQYEGLLRLSATLPPRQASSAAEALNLSRASPFGPLTQISSRRTFAYLIATLNASHPDYDFSHQLRPTDFRCERSLKSVMNTIDTTLYNLRPRAVASSSSSVNWLAPPISTAPAAAGSPMWGPHMWRRINKEMTLRECSIYCYTPEDDPYDGEDSALWSFDYFFFNKARKRVCYLYFRGLSIMSHSPVPQFSTPSKALRRTAARRRGNGASKRAQYWLGDRAEDAKEGWDEDDEDFISDGDDEVDVDEAEVIDDGDELDQNVFGGDGDETPLEEEEEEEEDEGLAKKQARSRVRRVSEDIADRMEV